MKKKILFLFFSLTLISFCASAQIKFGITAGAPFKLSSFNINDAKIENTRPFNVGLVNETMFPVLNMGFEVSALYEMERITGDNIAKAVNIGYLIVPIDFKWKIGFKPLKFFAKAGPSLQIMLHNSGNINLLNGAAEIKKYEPEVFNWGLNVGAGFELLQHFQAGVSYFYNVNTPFKAVVEEWAGVSSTNKDVMPKQGGFIVSLTYLF